MSPDELDQLAAARYDLDAGEALTATRALTLEERAAMLAWIAEHEEPVRSDRSDTFVCALYAGARRREARRVAWHADAELKREEWERRFREAEAKRELERERRAAQRKAEFEAGLRDITKHQNDRAEAHESIAAVRSALLPRHLKVVKA